MNTQTERSLVGKAKSFAEYVRQQDCDLLGTHGWWQCRRCWAAAWLVALKEARLDDQEPDV